MNWPAVRRLLTNARAEGPCGYGDNADAIEIRPQCRLTHSERHQPLGDLDAPAGDFDARRPAPRYERFEVPRQFLDLARRRTEFLVHVMRLGKTPLHSVLAFAYLQGINDAVQAIDHQRKRLETRPEEPVPWQC
jgi:hypothetical protein